MKQWPKIGSKIKYKQASRWFWYTNMVKDAEELLEPGKEYTVQSIELASSWCAVVLEEYPELKFSLSWFDYPEEQTTEEAREEEEKGSKRSTIADIEKRRKTYEVITKTLVTKHYRVEAENQKEAVDAAIEPSDTFVDDEEVVAVDEIKE